MHEAEQSSATSPPRAIVVDDDALARRTVTAVLRRARIDVVAEAADGDTAINLVREHQPDLVVMDVVMPGLDGVASTRRIVEERPHQVVILLTSAGTDELAMLGLRVGAAGFLSKDVDLDALPRAIDGALHGEAAISRTMAMQVINQLRQMPALGHGLRPVHSPLTTREWQVLELICEDKTTDEIADSLVISPQTVRSHIKRILRKLGVKSRREAVAAAQPLRGLEP